MMEVDVSLVSTASRLSMAAMKEIGSTRIVNFSSN